MFYKVKAFFMQGEETINMIVGELSHHSQQISSNRLSQGTYQKVPIFGSVRSSRNANLRL